MTKKEVRKKLYLDEIKKGKSPFVLNMSKLAKYNADMYLEKIMKFLKLDTIPPIYFNPDIKYLSGTLAFGITSRLPFEQINIKGIKYDTKFDTIENISGAYLSLDLYLGSMIKYSYAYRSFMDIIFVDFLCHELVHYKQILENRFESTITDDKCNDGYNNNDIEVEARKLSGEFLLNHTDFDKDLVELVMKDCNY